MTESTNNTWEACPQCGGELFENEEGLTECDDCGTNPGPKLLAERFGQIF